MLCINALYLFITFAIVLQFPAKIIAASVIQWQPVKGFQDEDGDGIRGRAGKDYPVHQQIPKTSFSCSGQTPGFYADTEAGCQSFHLCFNNRRTSFLCGNGTIFNQKLFTCDWWYTSSCSEAPSFYHLNQELYKESGRSTEKINRHEFEEHLFRSRTEPAASSAVVDFTRTKQAVDLKNMPANLFENAHEYQSSDYDQVSQENSQFFFNNDHPDYTYNNHENPYPSPFTLHQNQLFSLV